MTFIIPFLLFFVALAVHESAHAWASNKLGDPTAKIEGRLTLNPIAHIDIYGTIIVPLMLTLVSAPVFGWAKPVMINPNNFKRPSLDNFLTALAGPVSNLLAAFLCAIIAHFSSSSSLLGSIFFYLLEINVTLAVFNLLPIPPLDGSKIWYLFLSPESAYAFESYGPLILIAVIFFSSTSNNFLMNTVLTISQFIISLIS